MRWNSVKKYCMLHKTFKNPEYTGCCITPAESIKWQISLSIIKRLFKIRLWLNKKVAKPQLWWKKVQYSHQIYTFISKARNMLAIYNWFALVCLSALKIISYIAAAKHLQYRQIKYLGPDPATSYAHWNQWDYFCE